MIYTVASNGSLGYFPGNSLTRFSNVIPESLQEELRINQQNYIRLKKIAVARTVKMVEREAIKRRKFVGFQVTYQPDWSLGTRMHYYMEDYPWDLTVSADEASAEDISLNAPPSVVFLKPWEERDDDDWERIDYPTSRFVLIRVKLSQLDRSVLSGDSDQVLGEFYIDPADTSSKYHVQEFQHPPFVKISQIPLTQLTLELIGTDGQPIEMEGGPPTVAVLEVAHATEASFGMICRSNDPYSSEIFEDNTQGKFKIRLPSELDLSAYDVSLAKIVYPSHVKESAYGILRIIFRKLPALELNSFNYYYNIEEISEKSPTRPQLLTVLNVPFEHHTEVQRKVKWSLSKGKMCIKVKPDRDEKIAVFINAALLTLLGITCDFEGYEKHYVSFSERVKFSKFCFGEKPNYKGAVRLTRMDPLTFVQCNFVEENYWNQNLSPLLAVIPSPKYDEEGETVVVPENMTYKPVKRGKFSHLEFVLSRRDGSPNPYRLMYDEEGAITLHLLFKARNGREI